MVAAANAVARRFKIVLFLQHFVLGDKIAVISFRLGFVLTEPAGLCLIRDSGLILPVRAPWLATPMSISGNRQGAQIGCLQNAEAIQLLRKVDTLLVDKTGTLTEGKPKLVTIRSVGRTDAELLHFAGTLERGSEHPLGTAVVAAAAERGIALGNSSEFDSITGKGIKGEVDGHNVLLGNARLLEDAGVDYSTLKAEAESLRHEGQTVVWSLSMAKQRGC